MNNKISDPEIVRINLSTPFTVRTRCTKCAKNPSIYYYIRNPVMWFNPNKIRAQFSFVRKFVSRMCSDLYLNEDPKDFHTSNYLGFSTSFKSYRPRLHRTRGSKAVSDIVEYLACDCGGSVWAFSDKAVRGRAEIVFRKGRYKYPQKFSF